MQVRRLILAALVATSGLAVVVPAALAVAGGGASAAAATSSVPEPTVTAESYTAGTHHEPFDASALPLASYGYSESEFFMSGTTNTYAESGTWGTNGVWPTTVTQSGLPYKTRILVRRPTNPAKFSGTVIVEWLNDTATFDIDPDWGEGYQQIVASGDIWVGVSAQSSGINSLVSWDSSRYGSLSSSSDSQSYDIFSQAGKAIRDQSSFLLGGETVKTLIATGESQSSFRLVTYANAIQNTANVYQGIIVHSQWGYGAPINGSGFSNGITGGHIRTDVDVPIFQLETDTDVQEGFYAARQPDSSHVHTWEVAGSSHYDLYGLQNMAAEIGPELLGGSTTVASVEAETPADWQAFFGCAAPINNLTFHAVEDTALVDMVRWVTTGTPPPTAQPITTNSSGTIQTDANGNPEGGIQIPDIQVPTATYTGAGTGPGLIAPIICGFLGSETPFTTAQVTALYPTHAAYVNDVTLAAILDYVQGYLQFSDAQAFIAAAKASSIT